VLHRPVELAAVTVQVDLLAKGISPAELAALIKEKSLELAAANIR
jgi:hypothetical protein